MIDEARIMTNSIHIKTAMMLERNENQCWVTGLCKIIGIKGGGGIRAVNCSFSIGSSRSNYGNDNSIDG